MRGRKREKSLEGKEEVEFEVSDFLMQQEMAANRIFE